MTARDRVRIVHVINRLRYGGAERQLQELVHRSALDHEIVELGSLATRTRGQLVELARRLSGMEPSIVAAWLDRSQIAVAIAAPARTPLVAAIRGLPGRGHATQRQLLRGAFARFDCFVTNSDAARLATIRFARPLRPSPFHVIPNGIGVPAASAVARRGEREPLRVGYIGRDDPAKGLDVLLKAVPLLGSDVSVTLVGCGVPEAVARTGVQAHAMSETDDPWSALGECDVLVVPSRSEGSPNVVIEAFARGVPVVATAVGGTTALLGSDRGLTLLPDSPRALVDALRAVDAYPDAARERAARALKYVERVHGWPRVIAGYDLLFSQFAEG